MVIILQSGGFVDNKFQFVGLYRNVVSNRRSLRKEGSQTSVVDKTVLIQTESFKGMDANGTFRNLAHVLAPVGYLFL